MYLYKKIRKARPYRPSYFIDKIECRNYIHTYERNCKNSLRPSSPVRNFANHRRQVDSFTVPAPSILHIFLVAAAAECPHLNSYNIKLRFRSFSMINNQLPECNQLKII
jgi:hypothetical protein